MMCRYCPPQGEKEDERGTEALYCLTSRSLYCRVRRHCPPQGEKEDERGTEALYCLTSGPLYCRVCRYCPPQGEKEDERGTEALYCLTSGPCVQVSRKCNTNKLEGECDVCPCLWSFLSKDLPASNSLFSWGYPFFVLQVQNHPVYFFVRDAK